MCGVRCVQPVTGSYGHMQELLEQGSPAELSEAAEALREYSGALAAQDGSLDACLAALRRLTSRQVRMHITCKAARLNHGSAILEGFLSSSATRGYNVS